MKRDQNLFRRPAAKLVSLLQDVSLLIPPSLSMSSAAFSILRVGLSLPSIAVLKHECVVRGRGFPAEKRFSCFKVF